MGVFNNGLQIPENLVFLGWYKLAPVRHWVTPRTWCAGQPRLRTSTLSPLFTVHWLKQVLWQSSVCMDGELTASSGRACSHMAKAVVEQRGRTGPVIPTTGRIAYWPCLCIDIYVLCCLPLTPSLKCLNHTSYGGTLACKFCKHICFWSFFSSSPSSPPLFSLFLLLLLLLQYVSCNIIAVIWERIRVKNWSLNFCFIFL